MEPVKNVPIFPLLKSDRDEQSIVGDSIRSQWQNNKRQEEDVRQVLNVIEDCQRVRNQYCNRTYDLDKKGVTMIEFVSGGSSGPADFLNVDINFRGGSIFPSLNNLKVPFFTANTSSKPSSEGYGGTPGKWLIANLLINTYTFLLLSSRLLIMPNYPHFIAIVYHIKGGR